MWVLVRVRSGGGANAEVARRTTNTDVANTHAVASVACVAGDLNFVGLPRSEVGADKVIRLIVVEGCSRLRPVAYWGQ